MPGYKYIRYRSPRERAKPIRLIIRMVRVLVVLGVIFYQQDITSTTILVILALIYLEVILYLAFRALDFNECGVFSEYLLGVVSKIKSIFK